MTSFGTVYGQLRRVDVDRAVVQVRNNFVHVLINDDIGEAQREQLHNEVGRPVSLFARKESGRLMLMPAAPNTPMYKAPMRAPGRQ